MRIEDRIRCSSRTLLSDDEGRSFVSEGILASGREIEEVREDSRRIQVHSCAAVGYRCMKCVGPGDEDLRCRHVDYGLDNPHRSGYWF